MTRYLLATWEGGGVVPPELGLARRLIAAGHDVRVLADPAVEQAARATGCAFSPWVTAPHRTSLAPDDDILHDWEIDSVPKLFRRLLDVFLCGPADRFAADTLGVLAKHPADVVIADAFMFGTHAAVESAKLPLAIVVPNIYMRPVAGTPPMGPGFLPATNVLGRLRDAVVTRIGNRMWRQGLPALNRARAGLGLVPIDDIWAQFDRAARVFVLSSRHFDFVSPAHPANVRYLGPILDEPSWACRDATVWMPSWPARNRDPIVLVALSSTFQDQVAVLERIVAAVAGMPVRALVTLGPALAADCVRSPDPRVAIVPTAPHGPVLAEAAAAITHCGHGTTLRALAAGVPLVCMPMGRDQNDTAARVVARGAGIRIKQSASSAAIRRALATVLADPAFGTAARRLRAQITREVASTDHVAELEALAHTSATLGREGVRN